MGFYDILAGFVFLSVVLWLIWFITTVVMDARILQTNRIKFVAVEDNLKPPYVYKNGLVFCAPKIVILAPLNSQSGWSQIVNLGFKVEIPDGYIGVLTYKKDCFVDNADMPNKMAGAHPTILPEGWSGKLSLQVWNQHQTETAAVDKHQPIAELKLVRVEPVKLATLMKEEEIF